MQSNANEVIVSRGMILAGRIISALVGLCMLLDGVTKVIKLAPVMEATGKLGFTDNSIQGIGAALVISTIVYLIPQTAVLGAILLTGYLGGAIATNVRFTPGLFPIVFAATFGVLVWLGLFLREGRLHALIPLRRI